MAVCTGRVPVILLLVVFLLCVGCRVGWLVFWLVSQQWSPNNAIASKSVPTQTELPKQDSSAQSLSCKECLSLSVVPGDGAEDTCLQCEQVNDFLCLVAKLKEEVERLRSESKKEILWSFTLPSLREAHQEPEDTRASYNQAEGGDLVDEGK